jgi:hypothetical protein
MNMKVERPMHLILGLCTYSWPGQKSRGLWTACMHAVNLLLPLCPSVCHAVIVEPNVKLETTCKCCSGHTDCSYPREIFECIKQVSLLRSDSCMSSARLTRALSITTR